MTTSSDAVLAALKQFVADQTQLLRDAAATPPSASPAAPEDPTKDPLLQLLDMGEWKRHDPAGSGGSSSQQIEPTVTDQIQRIRQLFKDKSAAIKRHKSSAVLPTADWAAFITEQQSEDATIAKTQERRIGVALKHLGLGQMGDLGFSMSVETEIYSRDPLDDDGN